MPTLALPLEDYLESGNKSSPRGSSHGLDSLIAGQNRSKKIQNWMGYKALGRRWQASNNIGRAVSVAHAGLGYSTQLAYESGPQQLYVSTVPSSAPQGGMIKAAVAHRPELWVSTAVVNAVNGVSPVVNGNVITHANLMPEGGTKVVEVGPERYNEKYSYAGMPTEVPRVGYAVPDGCTIERTANGRALRFLDSDGVQYMHTQDAYGWWGAPEVSLLIQNTGGVELIPQGTQLILGRTYHIFDLVPVAAEWAASFGQVHIDPTTTISGATDIDCTYMASSQPTYNNGGKTLWVAGNDGTGADYTAAIRLATSALPVGTATLLRYDTWVSVNWGTHANGSGTINMYAGLRAFGEGVKNGATATTGEASWNDYAVPNAWGTAGGLLSGTDFEADASPPTYTTIANPAVGTAVSMTAKASWVERWKTGSLSNNGTMFVPANLARISTGSLWGSDLNSTYPLTAYIEYGVAAGNPHYYYNMLKRRR